MDIVGDDGNISPDVADALGEITNVGIGMATTALGRLTGLRVMIDKPLVKLVDAEIISELSLNPEREVVGVIMTLERTLEGAVLLLMEKRAVLELMKSMTGVEYTEDDLLTIEGASDVNELMNIIAARCMKSIGDYAGIRIYLSAQAMGVDMIGALAAFPLAMLSMLKSRTVCVDTKLFVSYDKDEKAQTAGHIILLPKETSVDALMRALEV